MARGSPELGRVLIALLRARTVNLSELATAFCGQAQTTLTTSDDNACWEYEVDEIAILKQS